MHRLLRFVLDTCVKLSFSLSVSKYHDGDVRASIVSGCTNVQHSTSLGNEETTVQGQQFDLKHVGCCKIICANTHYSVTGGKKM
jgi:hypothetical protein